MQSSVPAVKAALKTRLEVVGDLSDFQVAWGHPAPDPLEDKLVGIGPARREPLEYTAALAQANERYTIEILVSVEGEIGESVATLKQEAWDAWEAVEADIVSWRGEDTPFDGVASMILPGEAEDEEGVSEDGSKRSCDVTGTLEVLARIS